MATFPQLKTGAVAQYPATKSIRFQNQTVRFLDGSEQRYRDSVGALHQWIIQLSELDESEMAAFEQFFEDNQGRLGSFAFTDPWDGMQYPNCSLASDALPLGSMAEMQGQTSLTVIENRNL
jgi:phage-related protein